MSLNFSAFHSPLLAPSDCERKKYLAQHVAFRLETDSTISNWLQEYEEIVFNHADIVRERTRLASITRIDSGTKRVHLPTLMNALVGTGHRVVVATGEFQVPGSPPP